MFETLTSVLKDCRAGINTNLSLIGENENKLLDMGMPVYYMHLAYIEHYFIYGTII